MVSQRETALIVAAGENNIPIARLLLALGAKVNKQDDYTSPLALAATSPTGGSMALFLLSHGANPNPNIAPSNPPLLNADQWANVTLAQALIVHGADVNAEDDDGNTVLIDAVTDVINSAESQRKKRMIIEKMDLSKGADRNAYGTEGYTPLMVAVNLDSYAQANLILQSGADVNMRTHNPSAWKVQTALSLELARKHIDIRLVQLLKRAGAKP